MLQPQIEYNLMRFDADENGGETIKMDHPDKWDDFFTQEVGIRPGHQEFLTAVDMDSTMFIDLPELNIIGDMGILVFIEKLMDPSFWKIKTHRFAGLLLPKKYHELAIEYQHEDNPFGAACKRIIELKDDIVELYRLQRVILNSGSKMSISNPLIEEFALKMLEFDNTIKYLEREFQKDNPTELLMRVRFFAGSNVDIAYKLASQAAIRGSAEEINLKVHEQLPFDLNVNGHTYSQRVKDLPPRTINPVVQVNDAIVDMLAFLKQAGSPRVALSANILQIVKGAISGVKGYRDAFHGEPIRASELNIRRHKKNEIARSHFNGKPMFGPQKAKVAEQLASELNAEFKAAFGDSSHTDIDMMDQATTNKGAAVIIAGSYDEARRRFDPRIQGDRERYHILVHEVVA